MKYVYVDQQLGGDASLEERIRFLGDNSKVPRSSISPIDDVTLRMVGDKEEFGGRARNGLPVLREGNSQGSDVSLRSGGRTIVMTGEDRELSFDLGLVAQLNLAPKPFAPSLFDLKVHYIGRARGELRESCALDRLDRDIWLVLGAGTTIETLGGANPGVDVNEEAMQSADRRAREMLRERDRIDLTEALLINYFKPERNTVHKDRLSLSTKLMKRCYEAGLTGLLLAYGSMHLGVATYTEASGRSLFHSSRICL